MGTKLRAGNGNNSLCVLFGSHCVGVALSVCGFLCWAWLDGYYSWDALFLVIEDGGVGGVWGQSGVGQGYWDVI